MSAGAKVEPKKIDPRWSAAIHESGHAVMACMVGVPIKFVTVVPDDDVLGKIEYLMERKAFWQAIEAGNINWRIRERVEAHIISLLAGRLTEQKLFGIKEEDYEGNDDHDLWAAFEWAKYVTGSDDEAVTYLRWLKQRTLNVMRYSRYLRAVKAVALELMNNQTLSARQVHEVFSKVVYPEL